VVMSGVSNCWAGAHQEQGGQYYYGPCQTTCTHVSACTRGHLGCHELGLFSQWRMRPQIAAPQCPGSLLRKPRPLGCKPG
jgi:hypothetical protein